VACTINSGKGESTKNIAGCKIMGQNGSKERDLYVQMLKAMLKTRGSKIRSLQLAQFLDYVQDTCPWFPEEGTVNLDTWQKVGERLQDCYTVKGPDGMPVFTFGLWSQIRDCLDPKSHT
jgi:hypothetical protein